MKSSELIKATFVVGAVLLTCNKLSAQTENSSPIKGRWGLSTGVNFDQYKFDISYERIRPGILPMLTYTYGKNQFELGPQFQLVRKGTQNEYIGVNFNYKRYFNGFGNRFVPYLYSGLNFTMSRWNGIHPVGSGFYANGNDYRQIGINLSIGYGLEWQLGKHFYLGSAVGFNPGVYSLTKTQISEYYLGMTPTLTTTRITGIGLNFNVNMQVGYRFGK